MNVRVFNQLRVEQTALKRMLDAIPKENVLDRSGLEARLDEVSGQLQAAGTPKRAPGRAVLTFRGGPVAGQQTTLQGNFQGVLPKARRFEFELSANGEIVRGKIGPAVGDPDVINRHLRQPTTISVMATRVGNGKPRYVLLALPSWGSFQER